MKEGSDHGRSMSVVSFDFLLLLVFAACGALLYPISAEMAGVQEGDGILPAIMSTQKLTWYYWGQDRFLNFLPALAAPFTDVGVNLHVQVFLRSFMSALAPIGVLALLIKDGRQLLVATALAGLLLASCGSGFNHFSLYAQHNPFSTSLAMFGVAAIVLRSSTSLASLFFVFLLSFIGYAVNIPLIILVVPLVLVCALFLVADRKYLGRLLLIQSMAFLVAFGHAKIFGEANTSFGLHPSMAAIAAGWATFHQNMHVHWMAGMLLLAGGMALRMRCREVWLCFVLMCGMPLAVTAMSCLTWVQMNQFNIRYSLIFVVVFCACFAFMMAAPFASRLTRAGGAFVSVVCVLVVFFAFLGGLSATPWELVDPRWRTQAEAVADVAADANVQVIAGDYWEVWPSVFSAQARADRRGGSDDAIYGATYRGHVMRAELTELLKSRGSLRYLCLRPSLAECMADANGLILDAGLVRYVEQGARNIQVAGKAAVIYDVVMR